MMKVQDSCITVSIHAHLLGLHDIPKNWECVVSFRQIKRYSSFSVDTKENI